MTGRHLDGVRGHVLDETELHTTHRVCNMKTNSEKTELALRSISIYWLAQALFEKYAPAFSDKVDWKAYAKLGREEQKVRVIELKNDLKEESAAFHNDLCGALNLISIAAHSRKIKQYMVRTTTKNKEIANRFNHESLREGVKDAALREPINTAAWLCAHEEDMPAEWEKLKQFAIAEEQRYYNWTWYSVTDPTKEALDDDIKAFENALKDIFHREKDDENFAAKAYRLAEAKNFIRYCVSTAKDPIETFLALNGGIERGNDPTANTFLIDHYFNCNCIRIAFPDVIESDRVAGLFAEHVLGCEVTTEEPRIYLGTMRKYATRGDCETAFEAIMKECKDVKDIRLKAIRFTVAEDLKRAELRRRTAENKVRASNGLPPLPRLKCEVFEDGRLFDEMERCFSANARRKELMDVYELVFKIQLFSETGETYLSKELHDDLVPSNSYTLRVTPKSVRFSPRIQEVTDNTHRKTLQKIQRMLEFANEPAAELIRKEQG